jgi:hypothetical protein
MTEQGWLTCSDPRWMLGFVRGKVSGRKLRLFACACVRRIWHRMGEDATPKEVEASERVADGELSGDTLKEIRSRLGARGGYSATWASSNALHAVLEEGDHAAATGAALHTADFFYFVAYEESPLAITGAQEDAFVAQTAQRRELAALARDVFGDPFRSPSLCPHWLTPDVAALARSAYDERILPAGTLDPQRLAVLADALEEVGCGEAILSHLRSFNPLNPHVRGCWAIDLILGKE